MHAETSLSDTIRKKEEFLMKKGLILVLAALMLAVSLTACAATQPYYDGYSNVSTTRNWLCQRHKRLWRYV